MTANQVLELLLKKYPNDKFLNVPECKTGATWSERTCPRMDLWTMSRSWSKLRFIGHEIKVSRNDFLLDHKWESYLPFCKEFYFVAPVDVIRKEECPEQAGLLTVNKNGTMIVTKKKAPVRDVEIPQKLFVYILMSRTEITSYAGHRKSTADFWRDQLLEHDETGKVGRRIAEIAARKADRTIADVRAENNRLFSENQNLRLEQSLGLRMDEIVNSWNHRVNRGNKLLSAVTGVDPVFMEMLNQAYSRIGIVYDFLKHETEKLSNEVGNENVSGQNGMG